ncbi:OmpP1/FadL family transporter [Leisingera sp. JC1]|uniref:OmpP1/FadL family transporter n=1 Tax=Leisingera sp. JC1 TaxID=1855282 RepID=UPI000802C588|nr:outer membrane protein transport protein [Leisingera sp. JC1]OBY26790.1 hypothetical protein A9D60_17520 [Leisingera sp. JC1]
MNLKKNVTLGASALAISATMVAAGEIERRGDPSQILFQKGKNYLEFSAAFVNPSVSGVALPGIPAGPTGNITNSYKSYALGYKHELNERVSLAFVIDEPIGASVSYASPLAFFGGSSAEISSIAYTGLAKYQVNDRFSVYGGLRFIGVDGAVTVVSPASAPSPYSLSVNKDYQLGYLAGVAYEIPDIAFRIAATYESKTEHDFRDNTGSPFQVEIPKSFTLHAQSGISANTLLFGSVKWREWSKFKIQPGDFFSLVPGVGAVNTPIARGTSDIWTYEVGIAHSFSESWSGAATIGYEKDLGDIVGNFSGRDGYVSYGLAAIYEVDGWKVTTGVRYIDIGDADTSVSSFTENDAISAGIKVGYTF